MKDISLEQKLLVNLNLYPPFIRREINLDSSFLKEFKVESSMRISVPNKNVSFDIGELFSALKKLQIQHEVKITDEQKNEWTTTTINKDDCLYVQLKSETEEILIDNFNILTLGEEHRLLEVKTMCRAYLLGEIKEDYWVLNLTDEKITDNLVFEFYEELKIAPSVILENIKEEVKTGKGKLTNLTPKSEAYYELIIGCHNSSDNIMEYAQNEAIIHINYLVKSKGWKYLLSNFHHVSLSKAAVNLQYTDYLDEIFIYAHKNNPLQLAALLELGFWSGDCDELLNETISNFLECNDACFEAFSSIFILVYGEMSLNKLFEGKPVFYRRLAALTHSTLLLDMFNELKIDLSEFHRTVRQNVGTEFAFQTLFDLYSDPRWFPDYLEKRSIKDDLVGRIINAYSANPNKYNSTIVAYFNVDDESSLASLITMQSYLPSPIEGNVSPQAIPPNFDKLLKEKLYSDDCSIESLAPVFNLAVYFEIEKNDIVEVIKQLKENQRRVNSFSSQSSIHFVLSGLARVACVTNNKELANELLIVKRVYQNYLDLDNSIIEVLSYGLIAAASFENKVEWAEFVGNWITELAYLDVALATQQSLEVWVDTLCKKEPVLFHYCGKALAALQSSHA
ncbi:MAG: hypothetical protein ACI83B_002587 [Sediminicola sp.]|jgi:hypothetical protein